MSVKVRNRSGDCQICLEKTQKTPLFFWKKLAEKFWQKNPTRRSTERCTIVFYKEISISKLTVKTGLENIYFAL